MPLFSDSNASELWVVSFWNNLSYLFHHCLSFCQYFFLQTTRRSLASTAILNSQSLQVTYPFPPWFCVPFQWLLREGKILSLLSISTWSSSSASFRLRQEESRAPRAKWALRHVWHRSSPFCCVLCPESSLWPSGGPGSITWEPLTGRNRLSLFYSNTIWCFLLQAVLSTSLHRENTPEYPVQSHFLTLHPSGCSFWKEAEPARMEYFWESFPAYGDCILQQARAVPSASGKWASPPCGLPVVCFPCDIIFEQQARALCFLSCLVNPITKPGPLLGGPLKKPKIHAKAMWYNNHKKYRDCFDIYLKIKFSGNGMFQPMCPFHMDFAPHYFFYLFSVFVLHSSKARITSLENEDHWCMMLDLISGW